MVTYAFRAKNLGPLRDVDWRIPPGVSVVVGPNGVGKSTLLRLPEFGRITLLDSLKAAVTQVFDGTAYLRNHDARVDDEIRFGASVDQARWDVTVNVAPGNLDTLAAEEFAWTDGARLRRDSRSARVYLADNEELPWHMEMIPRGIADRVRGVARADIRTKLEAARESCPANARAAVPGALLVYLSLTGDVYGFQTYRYLLQHIAKYGSPQSPDLVLQPSGENVFPLLRNWRDRSDHEHRFEFVLSTLREAFPHVNKLDFEQAGQTVTVAVLDKRYAGKKTPISRESTGFLTALLHLCAIASCSKGGLVTLDELETSLHPRAIKVLLSAFRSWAKEHDLSIVLATQSETVLDQFQEEPEKIQVLEPKMSPGPKPLTELYEPEWLKQFSLGDLFGQLEYGSGTTE